MRILVLSPYPSHSHRVWLDQLVNGLDDVDWRVLSLPARHFAWRIRSNPLHWYLEDALAEAPVPDLILATSMTDVATFKGVFHHRMGGVPSIVYFHENQFAYPVAPGTPESVEPRMVNLYSALAADRVVFNSRYNRQTFLDGAARFLDRMPDRLPVRRLQEIVDKSEVLPVPVRAAFYRDPDDPPSGPARLVWNHRWEYDKGPDRLLAALALLVERKTEFKLCLAGQRFEDAPPAFNEILHRFGAHIEDRGFVNESDYPGFLSEGGLVLSTAVHDFQGLAVLEAAAAGCLPVLPDRLVYPEWFDSEYLYASCDDPVTDGRALGERIAAVLALNDPPRPPSVEAFRFDNLAGRYRALFNSVV